MNERGKGEEGEGKSFSSSTSGAEQIPSLYVLG